MEKMQGWYGDDVGMVWEDGMGMMWGVGTAWACCGDDAGRVWKCHGVVMGMTLGLRWGRCKEWHGDDGRQSRGNSLWAHPHGRHRLPPAFAPPSDMPEWQWSEILWGFTAETLTLAHDCVCGGGRWWCTSVSSSQPPAAVCPTAVTGPSVLSRNSGVTTSCGMKVSSQDPPRPMGL